MNNLQYRSSGAETGGLVHHSDSWLQKRLQELAWEEWRLEDYYMFREQQRVQQLELARLQAGHFSSTPASILPTEEQQSQGQGRPTLGQPVPNEPTGLLDGESKGQGLESLQGSSTDGVLKAMVPAATISKSSPLPLFPLSILRIQQAFCRKYRSIAASQGQRCQKGAWGGGMGWANEE